MAHVVQVKVKVPSKESLEYFCSHWNKIQCPVLNGEFNIPARGKELTIEPGNISHGILDIRTETYDPETESVMVDAAFMGPKRAQAIDEFVRGDIRFCPRVVVAKDPVTKKSEQRIITWDLVHRPPDCVNEALNETRSIIRKEENEKDRITELKKKRR